MASSAPKVHRPLDTVPAPSSTMTRDEQLLSELGLEDVGAGGGGADDWGFDASPRGHSPSQGAGVDPAHAELREQVRKLRSENLELSSALEASKMAISKRMEEMQQLSKTHLGHVKKTLGAQIQALELKLKEQTAAMGEDEGHISALQGRVEELQRQLVEAGISPKPPSAAQASAVQNSDALARANKRLQDAQEELDRLRVSSASDSATIETLTRLQRENGDLQRRLAEALARPGTGAGPAAAVPAADAVSSVEHARLSKEVSVLGQQLREQTVAIGARDAEIASLKSQLTAVKQQSAQTSSQALAAAEARVLGLEEQLKHTTKELLRTQTDKDSADVEASRRIEELSARLQASQAEAAKAAAAAQEQRQRLRGAASTSAVKALTTARQLKKETRVLSQYVNTKKFDFVQTIGAFQQRLVQYVNTYIAQHSVSLEEYKKEVKERKRLFNIVQNLKGNIRVFCRVRPILNAEDQSVVSFPEENELAFWDETKSALKSFDFERVFQPESTQQEVFIDIEELITSVLDGYNVCIFAYGQTGSGKTHTMEGGPGQPGVNPRALAALFEQIHKREQYEYTLSITMMEIYNEEIRDLLALPGTPKDKKLEVRQGPLGFHVPEARQVSVTGVKEVNDLWQQGSKNRAMASNNVNEHSSRSHLILSVYTEGVNLPTGQRSFGKLHLIDLAGSERVARTQSTGDRLKEAQAINKSLSALGDVIQSLGQKSQHTPFRNSKLTHLLQDSLGGDSKVLMIVQVSPARIDLNETLCSLNFASRVRNVELGQAKKNVSAAGGAGGQVAPPPGARPQSAAVIRR